MPLLLCYTREGEDKFRDLNDSMHLALSYDQKIFIPLLHNTGILFAEADLHDGSMGGCTKTLLYPWLFRFKDGAGGVVAVRRNGQNRPDPLSVGSIVLYRTDDFVNYRLVDLVALESQEIKHPRCRYEQVGARYRIEWETRDGVSGAYTEDFQTVSEREPCESSFGPAPSVSIPDALPGNVLEVTDREADHIYHTLGAIYNTEVKPPTMTHRAGEPINIANLPKAMCVYNDGSAHEMAVDYDRTALSEIDVSIPGTYTVRGRIVQKLYPFPFVEGTSDPCIFNYYGRYYFPTSGGRGIKLRVSETLDGLMDTEFIDIYRIPDEDRIHGNMWAPELHIINEVPYIFTTVGIDRKWNTVQCHILRCDGDPADPSAWGVPRLVVKSDGTRLNEKGITLDMTYFVIDDVHYVAWSNRDILRNGDDRNEYGTANGPADIYIATIDPDTPWQLTSDPVCICRPIHGWDRIETQVDEGPYLLKHDEDLFITFSGASIGVLYCVGLLHAKHGTDLLSADSWTRLPYPVLTKESVPGQYGPGHNNFIKAPGSDDDLIVLHARPQPVDSPENKRDCAIRRVHWNARGYPVLDMTPERELSPRLAEVTLTIDIV